MDKQAIYEEIKSRIEREELYPGQWVVERELCAAFGISRTPIREILLRLAGEGLLDFESGKGYKVKNLSSEEIVSIFKARAAVEGYAARLACRNSSPQFADEIASIKKALLALDISKELETSVELGDRLHGAIISATKNFLLQEFYEKIRNYTILTSNFTKKHLNIEINSRDSHLSIIEALEAQDPDAAEARMLEHLQQTIKLILTSYINNSAELY